MIAIDANLANKGYRGIGRYIYHIVHSLMELRGDIFLFITGPATDLPLKNTVYIPFFPSLVRLFIIPFILKKKGIHIFHGMTHLGIPIFSVKGVRYISTVHDLVPLFYKNLVNRKYRLIAKIFLVNTIFKSDKIITLSHAVKEEIVRNFHITAEKVVVIYPGNNKDIKKEVGIEKKYGYRRYFLAHLPDDPRKNAKNIISAFFKFSKKIKNVELVFTGNYKKTIREIKPYKEIKFLGYVSEDELFSLYKEALALVYPSFYEGFGFPVLDAMDIGISFVTSSIGASGEIGIDRGFLVDPYSPEEIESALLRCSVDRKETRRRKNRAKKIREKFSWEKSAKKLLALYEEFL